MHLLIQSTPITPNTPNPPTPTTPNTPNTPNAPNIQLASPRPPRQGRFVWHSWLCGIPYDPTDDPKKIVFQYVFLFLHSINSLM